MELDRYEGEESQLSAAGLEEEIEGLKESLRLEADRNIRTLADFKNYRRRIERDGSRFAEDGKREILLPLLDIVDDMENALLCATDPENPLMTGVRIIHKKLLALLASQGVLPFESTGKLFNLDLHEALAIVKSEQEQPGTIANELRRGYLWNNRLLRPAQVRVTE